MALDILSKLEERVPGLAMVSLRKISLERRQGRFEQTEDMYQKYIEEAEKMSVKSFYAIKYARHLAKVCMIQTCDLFHWLYICSCK